MTPVIGFLHSGSVDVQRLVGFHEGLKEAGYVEGQNVAVEYRWANGHNERLPAMASELVAKSVAVIVTGGGDAAGFAAKAATSTIPIVIATGSDPVKKGFVPNLNRPGGNVTGASIFSYEMETKRLGLLHEAVPAAKMIAVLLDPTNPNAALQRSDVQEAATRLGVDVVLFNVSSDANTEGEIIAAFAGMAKKPAAAVLVTADPVFNSHRALLISQAAQYRLPAIYQWKEHVDAGGLISYGPNLAAMWRQCATLVVRILKGAKPADLPVEQPTRFELALNAKTAKSLGLAIPPSILVRADEVIE